MSTELKVNNSIELREYLFKLMDQYGRDGIKQIILEYEIQSLLLESKYRRELKERLDKERIF